MFEIVAISFIAGVGVYAFKNIKNTFESWTTPKSWVPTLDSLKKRLTTDNVDDESFPADKRRN